MQDSDKPSDKPFKAAFDLKHQDVYRTFIHPPYAFDETKPLPPAPGNYPISSPLRALLSIPEYPAVPTISVRTASDLAGSESASQGGAPETGGHGEKFTSPQDFFISVCLFFSIRTQVTSAPVRDRPAPY